LIYALIPCSKHKAEGQANALTMYWSSSLFRGAYRVAGRKGQEVLILSAKYGLLTPERVIFPYNVHLNSLSPADKLIWQEGVLARLLNRAHLDPEIRFTSYLGSVYADLIVPELRQRGYEVDEPLKGLRYGKRLAWFKRELANEAPTTG
jgi:hypothetical protein